MLRDEKLLRLIGNVVYSRTSFGSGGAEHIEIWLFRKTRSRSFVPSHVKVREFKLSNRSAPRALFLSCVCVFHFLIHCVKITLSAKILNPLREG